MGAITEKLSLRFVLKDALVKSILPSVLSVLSLLLTLTYLILVSPPLASLLVVGSTAYFLASLFLTRRQMDASQTHVQAQVNMSGETQATLNNIDAVKATGAEEHHIQRWTTLNQKVSEEYKRVIRWNSLTNGVQSGYTTIMLVLVVAAGLWLASGGQVALANIVLFQTGMALFTGAVSETQGVVQQIANVAVYQDKQADLLHTSPSYGTLEPAGEPGRIEARLLSFGYPGSAAVCNGVDLQVSPGEKVAVFGPSGTGKSTLLYVLLRLNDFSGLLRVGNTTFRDTTGVLFPKMTLVEGTVRDNLVLGNDRDIDDAELLQVLRDVNLEQTIERLPAKLGSRVQAGGRNFSTGQAQRLLMARAGERKPVPVPRRGTQQPGRGEPAPHLSTRGPGRALPQRHHGDGESRPLPHRLLRHGLVHDGSGNLRKDTRRRGTCRIDHRVVPDAGHSPASPKGTGGPAPQPHGRHALLAEPTLIPPTPTHRQRPSSG